MNGQPKDAPPVPPEQVNFFRPRGAFMRSEVLFIWVALCGWAAVTFGFQLLLYSGQNAGDGRSVLTATTFFGFPFHFWFSGQFLIVWFILLCFFFNVMVDRLTERFRRRP